VRTQNSWGSNFAFCILWFFTVCCANFVATPSCYGFNDVFVMFLSFLLKWVLACFTIPQIC